MPLLILPPLTTPCADTGILLLSYKNRIYIFLKLYVPNLTDSFKSSLSNLLVDSDSNKIGMRITMHDSLMLLFQSHAFLTE